MHQVLSCNYKYLTCLKILNQFFVSIIRIFLFNAKTIFMTCCLKTDLFLEKAHAQYVLFYRQEVKRIKKTLRAI